MPAARLRARRGARLLVVEPIARTRIVVLPPLRTGRSEQGEVLVQGLHEALISRLGRGPVAVLSRTSVLPLVQGG